MTTARSEVLRTALTAGASVGAAVALMLAFRRQRQHELNNVVTARLVERNAEDSKHDATERRVTELYVKAVEQLGSEKAVVRLGGLYALERLARDNPRYRQTIVNVICAYLRMPHALPQLRATEPSLNDATPAPDAAARVLDDPGEHQVRLTAQRVLAEHVRPKDILDKPHPEFWRGIQLDLTDAVLVDIDLSSCDLLHARFTRATFVGNADFRRANLDGVNFNGATFGGEGRFSDAIIMGCDFNGASFQSSVQFFDATIRGGAGFDNATFANYVAFDNATFRNCSIRFSNAKFAGDVSFRRVRFEHSRSRVGHELQFHRVTFEGDVVDFSEMVGTDPDCVSMIRARVLNRAAECVWPPGWEVITEPDGDRVLRRSLEPSAAASDAKNEAGVMAGSDRRAEIARSDCDSDHVPGKDVDM